VIGVARDVTDEKRRSEFEQQLIAIVSHDLRNPLHAILLGAQALVARGGLDERTARSLGRIRASADRAARMVQDLLDFTRARVGHGIPVAPRPADLTAIARGATDEARVAFPGRAIQVEPSGDARGEWDPDRLTQVAANLVVNALKYSPRESPVTVRVHGSEGTATLEVHNRGSPISPDLLQHLFEPYRRGRAEEDDRSSLGLGLYIAREIVRAHAGEIEVRSSEADGTTFTVRLPRRAAAKRGETSVASSA